MGPWSCQLNIKFHHLDSILGVYKDNSVWPTSLAWTPESEHHLVVGTQGGLIYVYDIRNTSESLVCDLSLSKQIYRMRFSPSRPTLFAVSSDNVSLHVFDLDIKTASLCNK